MANFPRLKVFQVMIESGLVPVFYDSNEEVCKEAIRAAYNGGIRVFEFTNRGDYAHDLFANLSKWVRIEFPDLILGAGSIIDSSTAAIYIQNGSNFIVSPILDTDTAKICNKRKIAWIPGCGTLSEISKAEELGAEIVKLFPGSVGGPSFVKAIKGPQPWSSIMPTGGVDTTESSLKEWFQAGVVCVGMGSNLFPKRVIEGKQWDKITLTCKSCLEIIRNIRNS